MATDMFAALSSAGAAVSSKANGTLQNLFEMRDNGTNITNRILDVMYTGQLPPEYYLRPIDLETEDEFLEELIVVLKVLTYTTVVISTVCIIVMCVLLGCYCSTTIELRSLDELEEEMMEILEEEEKKRKVEAKEEVKRQAEQKNNYMFMIANGSGPAAMAQTRPPGGYDVG